MATVKAIYEDGVFKPTEPVELDEHTEVEVSLPSVAGRDPQDPTGWKAIDRLIGIVNDQDGPTDVAANHDDYLYGSKRRQ
jgi:hypothetical protein